MLTKAHIKNFKSLRDVTVTFGRNNVLVGPNMSGKSNLLDFFKFVRDLLFPSNSGVDGIYNAFNPRMFSSQSGFLDVVWKGADDPVISFQIEGTLESKGELLAWSYAVSFLGNFTWGGVNVHEETLTFTGNAGTTVLIETKDQKRSIYGRDGRLISDLSDPNRLSLEYEFPNWDAPLLKKSIFSWKFYNLVPPLMRKPNPSAAPNSLSAAGDNLSSWLMLIQTRHSESFDRIRSAAKDVLPGMESIFTTPTPQSTVYVASQEAYLRKPITIAEMSDGELAFIAFLSLLYAPPELKSDVCFIEEPENHLHPRMMSVLTNLLRQVQQECPAGGGQIFLTTHSPYLLDKFSIDELLVLNKKEGATYVTRPGDRDELKTLISDEQIGLGELFYSGALSGA
jgi:predicted ATPase